MSICFAVLSRTIAYDPSTQSTRGGPSPVDVDGKASPVVEISQSSFSQSGFPSLPPPLPSPPSGLRRRPHTQPALLPLLHPSPVSLRARSLRATMKRRNAPDSLLFALLLLCSSSLSVDAALNPYGKSFPPISPIQRWDREQC